MAGCSKGRPVRPIVSASSHIKRLQSGTVQGDNARIAAQDTNIGAWRSPVAYSLGVRVVGRSNRLAPTKSYGIELAAGD
jgi:hypothetical protein